MNIGKLFMLDSTVIRGAKIVCTGKLYPNLDRVDITHISATGNLVGTRFATDYRDLIDRNHTTLIQETQP